LNIYHTKSSSNSQEKSSNKDWTKRKCNQINALFADPILSSHAKVIAGRLILYHHNNDTGRCDPAETTLSKDTGIKLRTLQTAISQLKDEGWIKVTSRRKSNETNQYRHNWAKGEEWAAKEKQEQEKKKKRKYQDEPHANIAGGDDEPYAKFDRTTRKNEQDHTQNLTGPHAAGCVLTIERTTEGTTEGTIFAKTDPPLPSPTGKLDSFAAMEASGKLQQIISTKDALRTSLRDTSIDNPKFPNVIEQAKNYIEILRSSSISHEPVTQERVRTYARTFLTGYPKRPTQEDIDCIAAVIWEQQPTEEHLLLTYRRLQNDRKYPPTASEVKQNIAQVRHDMKRFRDELPSFVEQVQAKEQESNEYQEGLATWVQQTEEQKEMLELENQFYNMNGRWR